jgi:hypothetical protein
MIKTDILIKMSKSIFVGIRVYVRAFVPVTASHALAYSGKDPLLWPPVEIAVLLCQTIPSFAIYVDIKQANYQ